MQTFGTMKVLGKENKKENREQKEKERKFGELEDCLEGGSTERIRIRKIKAKKL